MEGKNGTTISYIHLVGLQTPQPIALLLFFLFLMLYCTTLCGNLLIITLVSYSRSLQSPMYFFLTHLSLSDIILVTEILPNILHIVLMKEAKILFSNCIAQFYFFGTVEPLECLLLTTLTMRLQLCWILVITCWILSNLAVSIEIITISKLHFCGPGSIDHFFCDLDPILGLACNDTAFVRLEVMCLGAFLVVIPFFIITISYGYIIFTISKIPSITGRQKAFSTCSSHLTVVSIYFATLGSVYMVPNKGQSWNITKFLSLLYTVGTPLINPIIYSLRNEELKNAVGKLINNFRNLNFNRKKEIVVNVIKYAR
uniref:G-protein coupled receptors family 1 profile domain-containing protein n=1 Tax=Pyxicephalus adspersus TaxID=30357 RepID=A0AAV3AXD2_PYXAD|nr:TPA: hypothetical protein GDO54_005840 [Pyxicephalus adspersus]